MSFAPFPSRLAVAAAAIALLAAASSPRGQDAADSSTPLSDSALGKALDQDGLSLSLSYSGLKLKKLAGGGERNYPYGSSVDFTFGLDTEKAHLFDGGTFSLDVQKSWGPGVILHPLGKGRHLAQTDLYYYGQMNELWYRQDLFDGVLGLKVGKQDAGGDFLGSEWGGSFIAASVAQSPTIPMPTYPKSKFGAALFFNPLEAFQIQVGVYKGADLSANGGFDTTFEAKDGYFEIGEASAKAAFMPEGYGGTLRLGYWRHTGDFVSVIGTETEIVKGADGWYGLLDQPLWHRSPDGKTGPRLGLLVQYGYSPQQRLEVSRNMGVGLVLKAPFGGRERDEIGIGYSEGRVQNDDFFGGLPVSEVAWEAYYRIQIFRWLAIQPDVQVVPAVRGTQLGRSTLLGIKFEITP